MSKTAEQLREEIQDMTMLGDEDIKIIINKVLDVACMEVNNVGLSAHDTLATKTAINKLRPSGRLAEES